MAEARFPRLVLRSYRELTSEITGSAPLSSGVRRRSIGLFQCKTRSYFGGFRASARFLKFVNRCGTSDRSGAKGHWQISLSSAAFRFDVPGTTPRQPPQERQIGSTRLLFFHYALQGMLVLARKIHHLRHLGLGDFVGEHPALPDSMMMDVEHDLGRGFDILLEELLQHVNNKFHRRVVVVQYQDPIEIRALCLWLDLGDNGCGRTAGPPGAVLIIAHSGSKCGDSGRLGRIKSGS